MCIGLEIRHVPLVANKLPTDRIDYGCRTDDATRLNAAGNYTYVIGSESQQAAIDRVPGVTFLPFSTNPAARLYTLVLRNMLVSTAFAHSPRRITQAQDPAAAAAAMGRYYPRGQSARWRPSPPKARRHASDEFDGGLHRRPLPHQASSRMRIAHRTGPRRADVQRAHRAYCLR